MDLRSLALSRSFSAATLRKAIEEVAKHRKVDISAPSASLSGHDELAQQKWAAWRKKTDVDDITLPVLEDQLTEVGKFLDPVFLGLDPSAIWEPSSSSWSSWGVTVRPGVLTSGPRAYVSIPAPDRTLRTTSMSRPGFRLIFLPRTSNTVIGSAISLSPCRGISSAFRSS